MAKYNITFFSEKNLYCEGSPIIIESGALVINNENQQKHIQLKFKNITEKTIVSIRVKIELIDVHGKYIKDIEHQYLNLNAQRNQSFCDREPIFLDDIATCAFVVIIQEVRFCDDKVWTEPKNAVWEGIPSGKDLIDQYDEECVSGFRYLFYNKAKIVPFEYKDLWVCTCKNVNSNSQSICALCGSSLLAMKSVDEIELKKGNVISQAQSLIQINSIESISKGIDILESKPNWEESKELLVVAKEKLEKAKLKEKERQEEKARRIQEKKEEENRQLQLEMERVKLAKIGRLKVVSIVLACIIAFTGFFAGLQLGIVNNKYKKAKGHIEKGEYYSAINYLIDIRKYKNVEDLLCVAMENNTQSISSIIKEHEIENFEFPSGLNVIQDYCFMNCTTFKEVNVPKGIEKIGFYAYAYCSSMEQIELPNTLKRIDRWAFMECINLTTIKFNGMTTEWQRIEKEFGWNLNVPATHVICLDGRVPLY